MSPEDGVSLRSDAPRASLRSSAMVSIVAIVVLLVASLGARSLVNWSERAAGSGASAIKERAYFVDPSSVNVGVTLLVQFVIVPTNNGPITWVASNKGHQYRHGVVQGADGSRLVETLPTGNLGHGSWLTIQISGIAAPLKAWVT